MSDQIPQFLIVHCWSREDIRNAHLTAQQIWCETVQIKGQTERAVEITAITRTPLNGYCWFVVGPSGSKSGYAEQAAHLQRLERMVEWLKAYRRTVDLPDHAGYNPLHWAVLEHDEETDEHYLGRVRGVAPRLHSNGRREAPVTRMLICVLLPLAALCWFLNSAGNASDASAVVAASMLSVYLIMPKGDRR